MYEVSLFAWTFSQGHECTPVFLFYLQLGHHTVYTGGQQA